MEISSVQSSSILQTAESIVYLFLFFLCVPLFNLLYRMDSVGLSNQAQNEPVAMEVTDLAATDASVKQEGPDPFQDAAILLVHEVLESVMTDPPMEGPPSLEEPADLPPAEPAVPLSASVGTQAGRGSRKSRKRKISKGAAALPLGRPSKAPKGAAALIPVRPSKAPTCRLLESSGDEDSSGGLIIRPRKQCVPYRWLHVGTRIPAVPV